jgi:hypothetical protein
MAWEAGRTLTVDEAVALALMVADGIGDDADRAGDPGPAMRA